MSGRPLRFLAAILTLWVTMRLVARWPESSPPGPILAQRTDPRDAATSFRPLRLTAVDRPKSVTSSVVRTRDRAARPSAQPAATATMPTHSPVETSAPSATGWLPGFQAIAQPAVVPIVASPIPPNATRSSDRWVLSIWGIARHGRSGTLATGQLGASQLGARATYTIDAAARVAVATRISTPISGEGREVALGIDWQPVDVPVHLIAEHRLPLDGNAAQPAAFATAGVDRTVAGFRVEGYGQAGGVLRRGLFVDGAARVTIPITRLHVGIGSWAGAQRGASRVDIGPTVALVLPVADRGVRLTLDWRQRIAGDARPGSGPALSIGGDF